VIRGEIKRLSDSVNDLLLFTTPSTPAAGSTSSRAALEEARTLFAADAQRRGVQLAVEADDVMLPIASAPLHDILVSLLGNALDAAKSSVRITYSGGVLAVEDDGPGVTDGLDQKIFDPFFTLKPGGTGLGLALARRRAREAGGDIRCVRSGPNGTGARFEVTFAQ
jgi:signal transduction histidine kinase